MLAYLQQQPRDMVVGIVDSTGELTVGRARLLRMRLRIVLQQWLAFHEDNDTNDYTFHADDWY